MAQSLNITDGRLIDVEAVSMAQKVFSTALRRNPCALPRMVLVASLHSVALAVRLCYVIKARPAQLGVALFKGIAAEVADSGTS